MTDATPRDKLPVSGRGEGRRRTGMKRAKEENRSGLNSCSVQDSHKQLLVSAITHKIPKPAHGFGNLSLLAVLLVNCSLPFYHPCLERNRMESICFTRCMIIFCLLIRKSIREGREIKGPLFYLPRAPCSWCRPSSDK